jgi:hypothetical protein
MHDQISGLIATRGEEQLLEEIEQQKDLGGEGLSLQDQWMMEVHLTDLENTAGE